MGGRIRARLSRADLGAAVLAGVLLVVAVALVGGLVVSIDYYFGSAS